MRKALNLLKWTATLGSEPQNFLGAKWIPRFLERVPAKKKRAWALRFLSFSPHYFLRPDAPEYAGMKSDEYLEAVFASTAESRETIYDEILKSHLDSSMKVLDYGCGPGFLAKAVSPHVEKVYACDISRGVLACAGIVNDWDNIRYLSILEGGLDEIPDKSVDAVYSFAVIQHLTDDVFETVLANCASKLRPGGKLLLHIQLESDDWRTEDDWKSDNSIAGRVKYRYGLHCFARTEEKHREMVAKHGFTDIKVVGLGDLVANADTEQRSQAMLIAILSENAS
ncbi:MAG: methyltransferase domain-containing protein [Acidobacteriota bacterium]|nr:methyltransferase domain-containing protein [Acidobacteriota bacterium]